MVKEPPSFYIWTAAFSIILVSFDQHIFSYYSYDDKLGNMDKKEREPVTGDLNIGQHTRALDSLGSQEDVESHQLLPGNHFNIVISSNLGGASCSLREVN